MVATTPVQWGTGSTPTPMGLASGRVLRAARDHLGLSQEGLAHRLGVDVNTLKGWETGRRPLANVKTAVLRNTVRQLRTMGASPTFANDLNVAIDVDMTIGSILSEPATVDISSNPLANWVTTREWNRLLATVVSGPSRLMAQTDYLAFKERLERAAEATLSKSDFDGLLLLRRQALYILASTNSSSPEWIAHVAQVTSSALRATGAWTPMWVAGRSLAIARTSSGDPVALRDFIRCHLQADILEAANLNYWAYWLGDDEASHEAVSDRFMARDLGSWRGVTLLCHLISGLDLSIPHVELCIHSLWALLHRRPDLLDPTSADDLAQRCASLLDSSSDLLGRNSRREVDQLHYAARIALTRGA